MTLTSDHLEKLKAPFEPTEHEFIRGMAYIREDAITNRIEEVDPAWNFYVKSIDVRGDTITVTGSMTILGVTRENTGMATVQMTKSGDNEANEAEKSATTDALKRCARLFGVGRYLLSLPNNVRDERSLSAYLGTPVQSNGNGNKPKASAPSTPPPTPASSGDDDPINTMVTSFEVKKSKNGNPYLVCSTEANINVTVWSFTETFEAHGWDKKYHTKPLGDNKHAFEPHVGVKLEKNDRGFWDVTHVTPAPIVQEPLLEETADAAVDF